MVQSYIILARATIIVFFFPEIDAGVILQVKRKWPPTFATTVTKCVGVVS